MDSASRPPTHQPFPAGVPAPVALEEQAQRLLDFARGGRDPRGGFGWLDEAGQLTAGKPVETWITARMTHVFALAQCRGDALAAEFVDAGMAALTGILRDAKHGGWHSAYPVDTSAPAPKEAYAHAFVVLAAASASAAGHEGGPALLDEALEVLDERFWDDEAGLVSDACASDWSVCDPYRGVNANMHTVEAYLAAADVTGDPALTQRALRITTRVVHGFAREHDWRLPEHFDTAWQPLLDYNRDRPADPFRPYGVTIGHLLEWSRLALHVRTALGESAPTWLLDDARSLYRAGIEHGWHVDGADGFVYTTDFHDQPIVHERMHWVAAEAIAAAWALWQHTGEQTYLEDLERWWDYCRDYLIDDERGSWRHELDAKNHPSAQTWAGKPDVYHAYQASIIALLPEAASFIGAVSPQGR